ncbi:hypothetical protein SASPL_137837 [Salvia splendens]|uniref:Myb/SANT-like domain-containing protein n=1 Tax=Salvia splendens TaxID=180675 RepID=A0A8X8ZDB3_SALSN|nr:hypothetical protein SASPL_137837 [Salvia splendens]
MLWRLFFGYLPLNSLSQFLTIPSSTLDCCVRGNPRKIGVVASQVTNDLFTNALFSVLVLVSLLVFEMVSGQENSHDNEGSPYAEGSTPIGNSSGVKGDRSRRCWLAREEAALISALKELNANKWKADNGYRAGYLLRLAETIRREIPTSDIHAHPHVYSKVTTWKRNYSSLVAMMNRSGVGFNNNGDFKIDCSDEQWAQIVQIHEEQIMAFVERMARGLRKGSRVCDTPDAVNKIYGKATSSNANSGTSPHMTLEELFPDEMYTDDVLPEMVDESRPSTEVPAATVVNMAPKKRKTDDKMDRVLQLMNQIREDTNECLKEISTRIDYEFDLSTKRTEVFEQLNGIPGLTLKQQFYISKKLVKEPEIMDLFRGLPEVSRPAFVLDLLEIDGMI